MSRVNCAPKNDPLENVQVKCNPPKSSRNKLKKSHWFKPEGKRFSFASVGGGCRVTVKDSANGEGPRAHIGREYRGW